MGKTRDGLFSLALSLSAPTARSARRPVANMLPANSGDSAAAVRTGTTSPDADRKRKLLVAGVRMRRRPAPPMIGVCAVQPKYTWR